MIGVYLGALITAGTFTLMPGRIIQRLFRSVRLRTKDCYICNTSNDVLYRCRYQELTDWVFLCQTCLTDVKKSLRILTNMVELGKVRRIS